jgi:hypothetical protein
MSIISRRNKTELIKKNIIDVEEDDLNTILEMIKRDIDLVDVNNTRRNC